MKCVLQVEVEYDPTEYSQQRVINKMNLVLREGLTRVVMGSVDPGELSLAASQMVAHGDLPIASCPQHRAFKAYLLGAALSGSAVNTSDPEPVVVNRAIRIAEEAMQALS